LAELLAAAAAAAAAERHPLLPLPPAFFFFFLPRVPGGEAGAFSSPTGGGARLAERPLRFGPYSRALVTATAPPPGHSPAANVPGGGGEWPGLDLGSCTRRCPCCCPCCCCPCCRCSLCCSYCCCCRFEAIGCLCRFACWRMAKRLLLLPLLLLLLL